MSLFLSRFKRSLSAKLALALVLAVLLPLAIVSAVGARMMVGRLERELTAHTRATAEIALNVLLRAVQRIDEETQALAQNPELQDLVTSESERALVPRFLDTRVKLRTTGLVEIFLRDGRLVGRGHPGHRRGFEALYSEASSPPLLRALDYERYVTIDQIGGRLVIQSSAPIIDSQYVLRGAVVTTTPLNGQMAEYVRGVVQAEVGFLAGHRPIASTITDLSGLRLVGLVPPPKLAREVAAGRTVLTVTKVGGREYSMAFSPLQAVDERRIGMLSVAVSREELQRAKFEAIRSLAFGAMAGLAFALFVAYFVGRSITVPIRRLHRSTQAIAAGHLELETPAETEDEIGDLARAFQTMAAALREHRDHLAARMHEIQTLHRLGRALSAVLSLDQVLRLAVEAVTEVLGAERAVLLLSGQDGRFHARASVGLPNGDPQQLSLEWQRMARDVVAKHGVLVEGQTLAVPIETRERVVGALIVVRRARAEHFSESDLRLVVTFCDQAATAIENARLYDEVRAFSEEMEQQVQHRTAELRAANTELERALKELKDAQAQLIHSERMAGLGTLVASVAHEINTPAAAIQGSAQILGETLERLVQRMHLFGSCALTAAEMSEFLEEVTEMRRGLAGAAPLTPMQVRQRSREVVVLLEKRELADAQRLARQLVAAGAERMVDRAKALWQKVPADLLVNLMEDFSFLERSSLSIQAAIKSIVRLVGTLKTYAHAGQGVIVEVDLTDGLETTLTILHNAVRCGINVTRKYGDLPKVPVFADELNQVWTNLILNAVQAMKGKGEIEIETFKEDEMVGVRITDNGPGVPDEVLPRIFEPFFSTKPRGEGTGLGLSIALQIVQKHGGTIDLQSRPGRTSFVIRLPASGPPNFERVSNAGE